MTADVDLRALPVALDLDGSLADRVRDHVEGALGWQVVDDVTMPPALRLVDPRRVGPDDVPTVVVVDDDVDLADVAAAVDRDGVRVVVWPEQATRLVGVAAALIGDVAVVGHDALVVGGAAGGVGTTTVALALAGVVAWSGRPCVALLCGPAPVPEVVGVSPDAVAASRLWTAAPAVPGTRGLRVARLEGGRAALAAVAPAGEAVVDAGVDHDVDVLVLRRDRPGVEALRASRAAAAVVLDDGVVPRRVVREAAGGRRLVPVPVSARVARAHASRRVPAGLPGSWIAALRPLVG